MSLIEGVAGTIAAFGGEHILSKAVDAANEHIVVPKMDSRAREKLLSELLDKYGDEVFYNDFDAYLQNNRVIESLIAALREETNIQPVDKMVFIDHNAEKFINLNRTYSGKITLIRKISDVLALIYDSVYENTLGISPYTDAGRLQCDLHTKATGIRNDTQEILHILQDMQQEKLEHYLNVLKQTIAEHNASGHSYQISYAIAKSSLHDNPGNSVDKQYPIA